MKKINFLLSAFVIFIAMFPLLAWPNTVDSGDVNGDGTTNITDVTDLINYLLTGNDSVIDTWAADVDGSGTLSIADVTGLINVLLRGPFHPATRTFTINGVSFKMVYVEPGTFMMGSDDSSSQLWQPAHEVTLTRGFYISEYEVTRALYEAVLGVDPSAHVDSLMDHPKTSVDMFHAQSFCWELEKILKIYGQITLPTEAEWEYAARGGHKSMGYIYAGSDDPDEVAWYNQGLDGRTFPVGLKKPNELGLYDMSGNADERCLDKVHPSNGYPSEPQIDPYVWDSYGYYVVRGGTAQCSSPIDCRVYSRYLMRETFTWVTGFRFIIHVD